MRKMLTLAALVLAAGTTTMYAQGRQGPPGARGRGGPGMMMDGALLKGITLTDAQKAKLEELRKADREKMQAEGGRGRGGADFEAIRAAREAGDTAKVRQLMAEQRAKMDARRDAQIAEVRALLTSDQTTQFDANVAELKKREAQMGPGGGRRGRPGRPPVQ